MKKEYLRLLLTIVLACALLLAGCETAEQPQPETNETDLPQISVMVLEGCEECFDASELVMFITTLPAIEAIEKPADESLIDKYDIKTLPSVVITGDIGFLDLPEFEKRGDALVLARSPPPYLDVETDEVKGDVEVTVVTNNECENCFDVNMVIDNLKKMDVYIKEPDYVDYSEEKGKELVEKYDIKTLPALIFSKDLLLYGTIKEIWNASGTVEDDGMLVVRENNPPYYDIESDEVKGIVDLTVLTDESCEECYDYNVHKLMMQSNFLMQFGNEKIVDISTEEGKALIEKYTISIVPTVILSEEAGDYPVLKQNWKKIGTEEEDGVFIVRSIDKVPGISYLDIESGKVVKSEA